MSSAICSECGRIRSWRARRGARLADLRCECGGELRLATFKQGQGTPVAARRAVSAGRHYQNCEVCQRKTLRLQTALVDFRLRFDSSNRVFPAGTKVCGSHGDSALAADHPYWALIETSVTPALLDAWVGEVEAWVSAGQPPGATQEDWEWQKSAPQWLRAQLATAKAEDLLILRNTVLDHLLRARGLSISPNVQIAQLFGHADSYSASRV